MVLSYTTEDYDKPCMYCSRKDKVAESPTANKTE